MTSIYSKYFDKKPFGEVYRTKESKGKDRNGKLGEGNKGAPVDKSPEPGLHIFRKALEKSFEELASRKEVLGQPKSPNSCTAGASGRPALPAALKPEPLFILNIKLEDLRFGKLAYYVDQDPKDVAQEFCKKHLLERAGITYLEGVIRSRKQQVLDEQRMLVQQRLSRVAPDSCGALVQAQSMTLNEYTNMKTAAKSPVQEQREPATQGEMASQAPVVSSEVNDCYSDNSDYESGIDSLLGNKLSPDKKRATQLAEQSINSGYKLHMKGIKMHEREL